MKLYLCLCLVFMEFSFNWAKDDRNFTFTYRMAMRCKEHISTHGYHYDTFYRIDEDTLQHATVKRGNRDISYFEMHIAIQASSNGHVLLSPVAHPGPTDPVYEIVVGGGGNNFTELRMNLRKNARKSFKTPNILSTIEFRAFYIKISDDGLVEFGKEGENISLISYYDANTLPIKYFSFASWTGVEAKFLYDCPAPGDASDAITPDSQAVEPKLSNSDELKRSLLMSRLPSIPPSPTVQVRLGIKITHVKFDAMSTMLHTRMAVVMSWTDDSMAWNPTKFNGTTSLKFRQGQIWRPMFFVYNADSTDPFDTENPDLISIVHSGEATFHFQTKVTTWCGSYEGIEKWPNDAYSCAIVIEPWQIHEEISLEIMSPTDSKMAVFGNIDERIESEWEFTDSEAVVIRPEIWNMVYSSDDNQTHQSDRLILSLELRRRALAYNIVIYIPLLVLVTFVLMSFWSEPLDISRVWFYAGCTIIICMGLSNIEYLMPGYSVPSILVLYITVLSGILLALLTHVLLMTSTTEKLCKTSFMQTIMTSAAMRVIFCLPPIKISLSGEYTRQEDEEDGHNPIFEANVEAMESEDEKKYGDRHELAEVIDKTMFIVYSITFGAMLSAHY